MILIFSWINQIKNKITSNQHECEKTKEHLQILIDSIPTQVWYLSSPNTYGTVNTAHAGFLGLPKEKVEFQKIEQILPEKLAKKIINHNRRIFQAKETKKTEFTLQNHLGEERLLLIHQTPKLNETGEVEYIVCSAEDITEQRLAEKRIKESQEAYKKISEKLQEASITDELTGLPNRRGFNQKLSTEWKRTSRTKQPLTVLIIDIDYFKYYNDSKGHLAGDQLLQKVADTLRKVFKRPSDYFARYGGDEFIAVIPDTDWVGGIKLAEACRKILEKQKIPNTSAPRLEYITISIGIATVEPNKDRSSEELLKTANRALYKAKSNGRNRTEFEPE